VKKEVSLSYGLAFLLSFEIFNQTMEIILGSQSPRRRELVKLLGLPVRTLVADADEDSITEPEPALNVVLTAALKTAVIRKHHLSNLPSRSLLITADTTVALAGEMLNKPADEQEARHMLQAMRNRTHEVHSAVIPWTKPALTPFNIQASVRSLN